MCKNDLSGEKKFNLRGPREGKKSGSNKPVDEKKLSLAKSLFGKKKKWVSYIILLYLYTSMGS
jgi:hypothetical protein